LGKYFSTFWKELKFDLGKTKVIYKSFAQFYKLEKVFPSFKEENYNGENTDRLFYIFIKILKKL